MPLKAQCGGLRSLYRRSMDVLDSSRRSAIRRRALKAPSGCGGLSQAASPNKGNAMCLCVLAATTKNASYSAHSHLEKIVFRHETHICPSVPPSARRLIHPIIPWRSETDGMRSIIPPVGSAAGSPPSGPCLEDLQREEAPAHIPRLPSAPSL